MRADRAFGPGLFDLEAGPLADLLLDRVDRWPLPAPEGAFGLSRGF